MNLFSLRQQVFDAAPAALSVCRPDGRFLAVNDAYCGITGYGREELLAQDYQAITHPDDIGLDTAAAADLLSGKVPRVALEKRYLCKNGEERWVRISGSLIPDDDAGPVILAAVEDITRQKRTEDALRAAYARLGALTGAAATAEGAARRLLLRRLHDGAAQSVTALSFNLSALRSHSGSAEDQELIENAVELTEQCSRQLRTLSHSLETPDLPAVGLAAGVESWTRGFARRTGTFAETSIDPRIRLSPDVEHGLFRIVQEALDEIHGQASGSGASVGIQYGDAGVALRVRRENGAPDDQGERDAAWFGLRERAMLIGGYFEAASDQKGAGFTVRVATEPGK